MRLLLIWMAMILVSSIPLHSQCNHPDDYIALRALYLSTDGDNWTVKTGWPNRAQFLANPTPPVGTDMSGWWGIQCVNNRVEQIQLIANNLNGSIPTLNLLYLKMLWLERNQIIGSIPSLNLPNLQILLLANNQLTGSIENFNFPNLEGLFLYGNQLSGSIPNFNYPKLVTLSLGSNQLNGLIPNFNLPSLERLEFSFNQFNGPLPNFNLPKLKILMINNNQISGSIPNFIAPNLERLVLDYNQFSGSIPNFNLLKLEALSISNNQLSGTIPNFNLPKLVTLSLGFNQLVGTIPNFNLPNLVDLALSSNQLFGLIPDFNLPKVKNLELNHNQLSGAIPNFNLPNLEKISLVKNELSGLIPNFNLPKLVRLILGSNQLSGNIPNFNLPNLQELWLQINRLSGSVPDFSQTKLQTIFLFDNQFSGEIPDFNLPQLRNLRLDDNYLEGCLPSTFKKYCDSIVVEDLNNPGQFIKVKPDINLNNNPLLPWQGDFAQFCATDGSQQAQIGAPCNNGNLADGENDVIQNDCSCGNIDCPDAKISLLDITECNFGQKIPLTFTVFDTLPFGTLRVVWSSPIANTNAAIDTSSIPPYFDTQKAAIGEHYITLTLSQGSCVWTDTMVINLIDGPSSAFTTSPSGCVLDPVTVTYTGGTTGGTFDWDFGPDVIGNYDGPGPHDVLWSNAGTKFITLTVSKDGCAEVVSTVIVVSELPAPPIVNCVGGTSSSLYFSWNDVPGAIIYEVVILNPSNVTGTKVPGENRYEVTGLPLGQSVTIQVIAVLTSPCGNVASIPHTCTALDCGVLPTIIVAPVAPICLPGSAFSLDVSSVTITNPPTSPSTGSFTINGNPATTFDPSTLGAGTHTITYTLVWDNSCLQSGSTPVIVRATLLSDFTVSPGGCVLDPVTATYTGGTTGGTFDWDFGPDVIGNYDGPGPYDVIWNNAGAKTISLTINKDGCTSTFTTRNVTVNPVLAVPNTRCVEQRIDGVTFGWDAVTNASGYSIVVEVIGGATLFTGTVTGTTYDVPGLTEGTQVRITVTAVSTNGCPNTSDTQICTATSCPAAVITFPNQVISECLNSALGNIALPFTITNNLPNEVPTVTWSSFVAATNNAINNSVSPATFNPQLAGVGSHSLVLTYQQKDCIWQDSIIIKLLESEATMLKNDTIYLKKDETVITNILMNDVLPPLDFTITLEEFPSDLLTLIRFDQDGTLSVLSDNAIDQEIQFKYTFCDQCGECTDGLIFVLDQRLEDLVYTTLFTPKANTNNTLRFSAEPISGSELWIYNRWGQEIFHKKEYENDWNADGYPGGVYFYVLDVYGIKIKKTLTVVK